MIIIASYLCKFFFVKYLKILKYNNCVRHLIDLMAVCLLLPSAYTKACLAYSSFGHYNLLNGCYIFTVISLT